ncbi:MAG TPA: hypothetical protein VK540_15970 [Polyangiaceae bacterium]|nr:hypothetical protein [Polyangiaceae bacterium]
MDNRQELNGSARDDEQLNVQPDHAYLKLEDRPTLRAIAIDSEPRLEAGAIVFDSGKWAAFPMGGEQLGPFDSVDDAQMALREHRVVEGVILVLAWLLSLVRAPANPGQGGA